MKKCNVPTIFLKKNIRKNTKIINSVSLITNYPNEKIKMKTMYTH